MLWSRSEHSPLSEARYEKAPETGLSPALIASRLTAKYSDEVREWQTRPDHNGQNAAKNIVKGVPPDAATCLEKAALTGAANWRRGVDGSLAGTTQT